MISSDASMTEIAAHWRKAYREHRLEELSWTEQAPEMSLALVEEAGLPPDAPIVDVGGGASRLAAELLKRGCTDLTVADISTDALARARSALGESADRVRWVEADVRTHDFGRRFDLWHDRAVFHFMVEPSDREGYLAVLRRTLPPGGHLILATFGPQGPTRCSGLPVDRYDSGSLSETLGPEFELLSASLTDYRTPSDRSQQFLYAHLRRLPERRPSTSGRKTAPRGSEIPARAGDASVE